MKAHAPTHRRSIAVATVPLASVAWTWLAMGVIFAAFKVRSAVTAHGSARLDKRPVDMYLSIALSTAFPCLIPYPTHPLQGCKAVWVFARACVPVSEGSAGVSSLFFDQWQNVSLHGCPQALQGLFCLCVGKMVFKVNHRARALML